MIRNRRLLGLVLSGLCLSGVAWRGAQDPEPAAPDRVGLVLRLRFPASGASPRLALAGQSFKASPDLACFYQRRSYAPAWSQDGALLPAADELLVALGAAEDDGLRPEDYRATALKDLVARARTRESR